MYCLFSCNCFCLHVSSSCCGAIVFDAASCVFILFLLCIQFSLSHQPLHLNAFGMVYRQLTAVDLRSCGGRKFVFKHTFHTTQSFQKTPSESLLWIFCLAFTNKPVLTVQQTTSLLLFFHLTVFKCWYVRIVWMVSANWSSKQSILFVDKKLLLEAEQQTTFLSECFVT